MTDLQTAARQALKVLEVLAEGAEEECGEKTCPDCRAWRPVWAAITALRAALEQPEQEPVALFTKYGPPTMRDRDFWSAGYATATARAIEAALKEGQA